jgi:hypothetical protein
VSLPIENRESALRIFDAFHIHRQEILDDFWDESEFQDLQATSTIESWSDATHLLRRLWRHLPFGRHLGPSDYTDLTQTLSVVVEDAREQLYYWYTAGPRAARNNNAPVEAVHLFSKSRYLWFEHIAPIRQQIINSILFGHRIRYLDHFRLDYEQIELSFAEIRLNPIQFGTLPVPVQAPFRLVICQGRTHTYRWLTRTWEISLENPDTSLTDPVRFRLPPATPAEAEEDLEYYIARRIPTPPSLRQRPAEQNPLPLINRIVTDDDGWGTSDTTWPDSTTESEDTTLTNTSLFPACWCRIDVCTCNHRPNTPPTPPGITLWSPSDRYLPNNRI